MFSLREFESNDPHPQDIYVQQWIKRRRGFETEFGCLYDQVVKDVKQLEIIQEANMGGSYLRCFYKLQGNETIFEDVAFRQPYLKIQDPDYKWTIKASESDFWNIIKQNFTITKGTNWFIHT